MTKAEITAGVKSTISKNSRYTFDEIKATDPLDKFITSFMKAKFAGQLKRKFPEVNTTALTNQLYVSIKKMSQLVDYIYGIYNANV